MKALPTLYKKSSAGADQEWTIGTKDNVIVTRWGQIGGAMQEGHDVVKKGKNLGRANETTPAEQAALEAQSKWEKKLKKGYVKDLADAQAGKVDDVIEGGIFPMLAHEFIKHGSKLVYPAFVQPKLDGHRCTAVVESGRCSLWSRSRKPITSMPHIVAAIERLKLKGAHVFDGELYNHDYHDRFSKLSSLIRHDDVRPGSEIIEYHAYDFVTPQTFDHRYADLKLRIEDAPLPLHLVETKEVTDEDELMLAFDHFRALKYEGAMARNANGLYISSPTKRSYDLLKLKEFQDDEFPVRAVEEGRGKLAGHAIFICEMPTGKQFRVKMKGKTEELKKYFDRPDLAIGRQLTVKFQGYTDTNGVPRIPVALRFREDL